MIGFVSALSSSLAIIILIMSVMMLNMIISAQSEQDSATEITIVENEEEKEKETEEEAEEETEGMDESNLIELKNNLISHDEIEQLNKIDALHKLILYCEYGYTLDYNSAMKLAAFNTITLSKNFPELTIKPLKPILQESVNNTCFIKYEKR